MSIVISSHLSHTSTIFLPNNPHSRECYDVCHAIKMPLLSPIPHRRLFTSPAFRMASGIKKHSWFRQVGKNRKKNMVEPTVFRPKLMNSHVCLFSPPLPSPARIVTQVVALCHTTPLSYKQLCDSPRHKRVRKEEEQS